MVYLNVDASVSTGLQLIIGGPKSDFRPLFSVQTQLIFDVP